MDKDQPLQRPLEEPSPQKQPYAKPVLRVEGSIEKLTQNIGLEGNDNITGSRLI